MLFGCCGSGVYDTSKQLCCNDVIVPLVAGEACCGTKTINTDIATCCDGKEAKIDAEAIPFAQCCGKQAYDGRKQSCCLTGGKSLIVEGKKKQRAVGIRHTTAVNRVIGMTALYFRSFLLIVLVSTVYSESSRSERFIRPSFRPRPFINTTSTGLYNPSTEKCCLGSVYPNKKPAYEKCCGSSVYDTSKNLCCNDVIVPLVAGEACCGTKTINTDNAICCDGKEAKIEQGAIPFAQCCGKQAFDGRKQSCCYSGDKSVIVEGKDSSCCGDKTYDFSKQVCCTKFKDNTVEYQVLSTDGRKTLCCGESVYDPSSETCCGEKVVQGIRSCCGDKPFDTANQTCCGTNLIENKGKSMACCGDKAYNDQEELCCYNYAGNVTMAIVKKTDPKQTTCCGMEPYDMSKQICCPATQKVAAKSSPEHYQCCGDTTYDFKSGLCCNNVFYSDVSYRTHVCCGDKPMERGKNVCCGNKIEGSSKSKRCCGDSRLYDFTKQLCCMSYSNGSSKSSVVENANRKLACCGLKTFHIGKEICCGEEVIPKNGNIQCCGSKPYDMEKEICCSANSVFPKEEGRESCCMYGTTDARPFYQTCYYHYDVPIAE